MGSAERGYPFRRDRRHDDQHDHRRQGNDERGSGQQLERSGTHQERRIRKKTIDPEADYADDLKRRGGSGGGEDFRQSKHDQDDHDANEYQGAKERRGSAKAGH